MKIHCLTLCFALLLNSCFSQKEELVTELHENIFRINNQFFYSEEVNVYLFELEDKVLLFDIPSYSEDLQKFIQSFAKPSVAILSHGSCGIDDGKIWQEKIELKVYAHIGDINHPWLKMKPDVFFTEMPNFAENIAVIHTPGHSAGAICVLEKSSKSLFSGDTFYGDKNGEVKDFSQENQEDYENLEDRIKSCEKLLEYDFVNVYPFHFEILIGNGKEQLREYLKNK